MLGSEKSKISSRLLDVVESNIASLVKNNMQVEQIMRLAIEQKRLGIMDKLLNFAKKDDFKLNIKEDVSNKLFNLAIEQKLLEIIDKLLNFAKKDDFKLNIKEDVSNKLFNLAIEQKHLNIIDKLFDLARRDNFKLNIQENLSNKLFNLAIEQKRLGIINKLLDLAITSSDNESSAALQVHTSDTLISLAINEKNLDTINKLFDLATRYKTQIATQHINALMGFMIVHPDWHIMVDKLLNVIAHSSYRNISDTIVIKHLDKIIRFVQQNIIILNSLITGKIIRHVIKTKHLDIIDKLCDLPESIKHTKKLPNNVKKMLSLAIEQKRLDIGTKLLVLANQKSLNLNLQVKEIDTLINLAIEQKHLNIIDKLLILANQKSLNLNLQVKEIDTLINLAIEQKHLNIIDKLLILANQKLLNLNKLQVHIDTLINLAIEQKHLNITHKLFDLAKKNNFKLNITKDVSNKLFNLALKHNGSQLFSFISEYDNNLHSLQKQILLALTQQKLEDISNIFDHAKIDDFNLCITEDLSNTLINLAIQQKSLSFINKLFDITKKNNSRLHITEDLSNEIIQLSIQQKSLGFINKLFDLAKKNNFKLNITKDVSSEIIQLSIQQKSLGFINKLFDLAKKNNFKLNITKDVSSEIIQLSIEQKHLNIINKLLDLAKRYDFNINLYDQGDKILTSVLKQAQSTWFNTILGKNFIKLLFDKVEGASYDFNFSQNFQYNPQLVLLLLNDNVWNTIEQLLYFIKKELSVILKFENTQCTLERFALIEHLLYKMEQNNLNINCNVLYQDKTLLLLAIQNNKMNTIKKCLNCVHEGLYGINLSFYAQGNAVLSWACQNNNVEIIEKILDLTQIHKYLISFIDFNSQHQFITDLAKSHEQLDIKYTSLYNELSTKPQYQQNYRLNARTNIVDNSPSSSDPCYMPGQRLTYDANINRDAKILQKQITTVSISDQDKVDFYNKCYEYTKLRLTITQLDIKYTNNGYKITLLDCKREHHVKEDNHIIPISTFKLVIINLIYKGLFLNIQHCKDIFMQIFYCYSPIMPQDDLDIIKEDYKKLSLPNKTTHTMAVNFFSYKFFPCIFYIWDSKANTVFYQPKTNYLREGRYIKDFNIEANEALAYLYLQLKDNAQLQDRVYIDTLHSILKHFCNLALDIPICLRITKAEAITINEDEFYSKKNYKRIFFQNCLDYNLRKNNFNDLYSENIIKNYFVDIIHDISRIFEMWVIVFKLAMQTVSKNFLDQCKDFLNIKNMGEKIIQAKKHLYILKDENQWAELEKLSLDSDLNDIIKSRLLFNDDVTILVQDFFSCDQKKALLAILNTINISDASTSPSDASTSPSDALTSPSDALTSPSDALTSPSDALTSPSDASTSPSEYNSDVMSMGEGSNSQQL